MFHVPVNVSSVKQVLSRGYMAIHQSVCLQGSHRLDKYLNLEGFLEKSLKIKSALKSTAKSLKSLEKFLNSTIVCRN